MGGSINCLGIDVGTGGTRAVIIDERGRVIASGSEEHVAFASLSWDGPNRIRAIGGGPAALRFVAFLTA